MTVPQGPADGDARPLHALVVDDDPVMLVVVTHFLRARGYEVEQCGDGAQALARVRQGGIQLVVTDRAMPHMDGLALCRAIRALGGEPYVYCIMLTGTGDEVSLVAAMEAGVDDFLAKPPKLPELGARLHAAERVLALQSGLASRNRALAEAYGQVQRDLELARVLQLGQLPPAGRFGPVRFDWCFEASGYVGGDTLDYFPLGDGHLCFYVADVSGHGVAAAMLAFHVQRLVRALAAQRVSASAGLAASAVSVVTEVNRRLLQMQDTSLFITMLFGLMDTRTHEAALVQAGHPPALLAASAQAPFEEVGEGSVPLGVLADPGYAASCVQLPPGARLVLYSDGVTDCRDRHDENFGIARLRDALAGAAPAAATRRVHETLRSWRAGASFEDDVTMLALEAG